MKSCMTVPLPRTTITERILSKAGEQDVQIYSVRKKNAFVIYMIHTLVKAIKPDLCKKRFDRLWNTIMDVKKKAILLLKRTAF